MEAGQKLAAAQSPGRKTEASEWMQSCGESLAG